MKDLRKRNELFDNDDHHDSHEFFMWVINQVNDDFISDYKQANGIDKDAIIEIATPISDLFQGELASVTQCFTCEGQSQRSEKFIDLGIDIEKNTSLSFNIM